MPDKPEIIETRYEVIAGGKATSYQTEDIARHVYEWAKSTDKRWTVKLRKLITTAEDISEPEPADEARENQRLSGE
jgi:hypothetical protein